MSQPVKRNRCIYCRRIFSKLLLPSTDHVIPKGFGEFKKPLMLRASCARCNNKLGAIVGHILQKGVGGWMRLLLKMKASSKEVRNPLVDKKNFGKNKHLNITIEHNGKKVTPYFEKDGSMTWPWTIQYRDESGNPREEEIIQPAKIGLVATRMQEIGKSFKNNPMINADDSFCEAVIKELENRGQKTGKITTNVNVPFSVTTQVTAAITDNFARGCANILLKSMIYSGHNPESLRSLIKYAANYRTGPSCYVEFDRSLMQTLPVSNQISDYGHYIEWSVDKNYTYGVVALYCTALRFGPVIRFRCPHGDGKSVLIPGNGSLVANYIVKSNPHGGWCEISQGNTVLLSGKPKGAIPNLPLPLGRRIGELRRPGPSISIPQGKP
jgi:hypothetical protein